ncbi:MAG: hypothetical protein A2X51_12660 [Candidatus Rokubacteria bacterium GWC2_70_24]|nr:MAG: hypothetical protein A2X53_19920 [Candidatus Rokubacteria bacterium GWA2_70_23]OGK88051.1 MAG: hypothetical protein A2X51_12660 [Candidatus Rokubacteria bacterium GWC2_70_24]HAM54619.1 hypothetical protein [Candidatus Rokubacteria bacterium]
MSICQPGRIRGHNVERAITEGQSRADLHDRLREVVLAVPFLRDPREDIPLLVEHLLGVYGRRHGIRVPGIAPGALRFLDRFPWPGNVPRRRGGGGVTSRDGTGWRENRSIIGPVSTRMGGGTVPEHPPSRLTDVRSRDSWAGSH